MAASAFMRKLLSTRGGAFFSAFTNQQKAMGAAQALSDAISVGTGSVPIGAIIAWTNHITGTPALPDGWMYCNGDPITDTDSPMVGQNTPVLNGVIGTDNSGRFLRGTSGPSGSGVSQPDATAVKGLAFSGGALPNHVHTISSGSAAGLGTASVGSTTQTGTYAGQNPTTNPVVTGTITSTDSETRPINYGVRWIMRIK